MRRLGARRSASSVAVRCSLAFALLATACGSIETLSTEEALERLNVATTKVYDARGNVIADLHGEINRVVAALDDLPSHVSEAVIAIEDERFWDHQGVDLRSIVRAAVRNVGSAAAASSEVQGGSTISQQLAKNLYFPDPDRTLARKLAEARVTLDLERQHAKSEILEMYLNTIYFGRGVYGIETAARSYFGKAADELTVGEAAFLAGLIHEPATYEWSPDDPPDRQASRRAAGERRREAVLAQMVELGYLDHDEAEAAGAEEISLRARTEREWKHPYFVDMVLRRLGVLRNSRSDRLDPRFDLLGTTFEERSGNVYRGGLRIYTTLDPVVQSAAEQAVVDQLPDELDRLSVAIASVESRTGAIRALVGGRDYYPECDGFDPDALPHVCRLAKVNLALGDYGGGSGRQPGSSFKPFVLTAALLRGVSLARTYSSDTFSHAYEDKVWNVSNYSGEGAGDMDLIQGTVSSVNAVFAQLEIDGVGDGDALLGADRVATVARSMGIGFPTRDELRARCGDDFARTDACLAADDTPAIALGAKEVSPLDMASAYATFANDGIRAEPHAVVRITDAEGTVLYDADPQDSRVLPSGVARGVTYALQRTIQSGTAAGASIPRPAAAKTGTSQAWRDAWLAGFVPQLATVVWVGNPIPVPGSGVESMTPANGYPSRIVGGSYPARIWRQTMTDALVDVPVRSFGAPPSVFFRDQEMPKTFDPLGDPDPEATIIPSVIGKTQAGGRHALRRAGYAVRTVKECAPDEGGRLFQIWKQDPPGGSDRPHGTVVTIWYQPSGCRRR